MGNILKKDKGITLIALVITIIILLILAGISIASLTGSGLFEKATDAKKETLKSDAKERIQLEIFASYGDNGALDLEKLKENINKNIPEAIISGDEFPITVTLGEYSYIVEDNGNLEIAGPRPIVDKSSIIIEPKDGSQIPEEGLDDGTELKVTFLATMEDGTITKVTPGTVENGKITYITNGTEKEITFEITGEVNGEKYPPTKFKISLKDYYKKTEFSAKDIKKLASTFYGAEVTGYNCESDGVAKWRIFYADNTNIYLIADDTIEYSKAPNGRLGTSIEKGSTDNTISFNNVYNDYPNIGWILGETNGKENSLAKKWLGQYLNYTPDEGETYPNRNYASENVRTVAYLLDTNAWNIYAGEKAEYAMGGPTIELYAASYYDTHEGVSWDINCSSEYGYVLQSGGIDISCNGIYKNNYEFWMASTTLSGRAGEIHYTYNAGNYISCYPCSYNGAGVRPIVCLKNNVEIKKINDGIYEII